MRSTIRRPGRQGINRRRAVRAALTFVGIAGLAAAVTAHVRLRYQADGTALYWEDPTNIRVVINSDGSDDVSNDSHETAIRSALEAWNAVSGSRARLVEISTPSAQNRRDWQSNDLHTVLFDETGSSGYFAGASGIVAITPVTFFTNGKIIDADVLFNGKNFRFTTSGGPGRFDIQDVAAHELGHLIGLDHSGVCGATMYPYVDSSVILHRSLSLDDERGLRHLYPQWTFAQITGTVRRSGGSAVKGAHVVARDASGRLASAILTAGDGSFTLRGLEAGTYTVYADPLDQPVSSANLGGGQTIQTDFSSTILGQISVGSGQSRSMGTQNVSPDVSLSLGRVSDNYPIRVVTGASHSIIVRGTDLVAGSTLTASDPTISITSVTWFGSSVHFTATIPGGAPLGHFDLTATSPTGDRDILVGGLEITPPDPVVSFVSPSSGDPAGGTTVTLTGTGFRDGARVVIGNRIYRDGSAGGCTVVDSTTITLTTAETIAGNHDVVVIDPCGIEGRGSSAFDIAAVPALTSIFPAVGTSAGGTLVTLAGDDFVPGTTVEIDGVLQSNVTVESPRRISVVTSAGLAGGPYVLRVTAPGGMFAETAFAYATTPDPRVSLVTPNSGDKSGGSSVTVYGSNFNEDTRVLIGASVTTGQGGSGAQAEFISSTTLRVTTPASSVGTKTLMVKDAQSGQASTMEAGFTYTGADPVDDDGGGCASVAPPIGRPSWRDVVGGAGWIVLALLLGLVRTARLPQPRACAVA